MDELKEKKKNKTLKTFFFFRRKTQLHDGSLSFWEQQQKYLHLARLVKLFISTFHFSFIRFKRRVSTGEALKLFDECRQRAEGCVLSEKKSFSA